MIPAHSLDVAGLRFAIEPPPGFAVVEGDARYAPFLNKPLDPEVPSIRVTLTLDPADLAGRVPVFDSGDAWRGFREGADLLIDMAPEGAPSRLWTARLHGGRDRVTIHCGEPLRVTGGPEGPAVQNPMRYPLDQILMLALLPPRGRLVVHGAGAVKGGVGLAFPGYSGAGKSTISRLMKSTPEILGLSDDRIVLQAPVEGGGAIVHGTPWSGDERVAANAKAKAAALVFLHHAKENALRRIDAKAALRQLLPTACVPWFDEEGASLGLGVCEAIIGAVPAYELHFRPEVEALAVLDALW